MKRNQEIKRKEAKVRKSNNKSISKCKHIEDHRHFEHEILSQECEKG